RHRRNGQLHSGMYYCVPRYSVRHSVAVEAIHRLVQFDTGRLIASLVELTELAPRQAFQGEECTLTADEFARVRTAVAGGNAAAVTAELPAQARDFVHALSGSVSSATIRFSRRTSSEPGYGELGWVDADDGGLWLIAPAERATELPSPDRLLIQPVS